MYSFRNLFNSSKISLKFSLPKPILIYFPSYSKSSAGTVIIPVFFSNKLLKSKDDSLIFRPVKAVEPSQTEQPEHDLHESELAPAEEAPVLDLEEEMEVHEVQAPEEPQVAEAVEAETLEKSTAAKLSEYYGVSQINDAVVFVTLYPRAHNVQVAGDFNNWQPEQHIMEKVGDSGVWQTQMKLNPGRYRYRLVVDGQWQQDPYNESTEMNPFGGFNSVIEIK